MIMLLMLVVFYFLLPYLPPPFFGYNASISLSGATLKSISFGVSLFYISFVTSSLCRTSTLYAFKQTKPDHYDMADSP